MIIERTDKANFFAVSSDISCSLAETNYGPETA